MNKGNTIYRVMVCDDDGVWTPASDKIYHFDDSAVSAMRKYCKEHSGFYDLKVQYKVGSMWKDFITLDEYEEYLYEREVSAPYSPSCPWYAPGMKVSDFF